MFQASRNLAAVMNAKPQTTDYSLFRSFPWLPIHHFNCESMDSVKMPPPPPVVINDVILTEQQLFEFEKHYRQRPRPGQYWYDKVSGLFGLIGQPASGFMFPGHDYGAMDRKSSNGNTRVLINGRELTQGEYMWLCQMAGNIVFPGSYWLDAKGNAGMQGNPLPLINLFMAAQQRSHTNSSGSGDNFWTSRFSAGNYDGDSGYVSVPGYGPVGYGPM
jgi:hypothetical protein